MNLLEPPDFANYSFVDAGSGLFDASSKRLIVLAPNGSGKTTLCTVLKEKYGSLVETLSFHGELVQFRGKNNALTISADDTSYQRALKDYQEVEETIGKKAVLGNLGLQVTKIPPECKTYLEPILTESLVAIAPLTATQRTHLSSILESPEDVKRLVKGFDTFKKLLDSDAASEAELISLLDVGKAYSFYSIDDHLQDIVRDGCPFCGANDNDTLTRMRAIYQRVTSEVVFAFRDFSFTEKVKEKGALEKHILELLIGIRSLTNDQVTSLAITLGDPDREQKAALLLREFATRKSAKDAAERAQNAFFEDMKNHYDDVKRAVTRYSPAAKAELVPSEKAIKISLPRKYDTYSDGEKRDIYASIQLEIARSKEVKYLIVDDPFISLDNANQHRTVFRLASYANLAKQAGDQINIIIFTCDYSFLNIAHEQHRSLFSFAYLFSAWNAQRTRLSVELMAMPPAGDAYPYIGYHSLLYCANPTSLADLVISVIDKRAGYAISRLHPQERDDYNKLLHYDAPFSTAINNLQISNDDLSAVIDGQLRASEGNFLDLLRNNILYIAALRVWVEKKIYEYDQFRLQNHESSIFANIRPPLLLHKKIFSCDRENTGTRVTDYYPKWKKDVLLAMKTLLNENDHPYSMTDPFGYTISISRQALLDEIEEIKSIFWRP